MSTTPIRRVRSGDHGTPGRGSPPARLAPPSRTLSVILVAFVMIAFIGIPVFLSWKRNRG
jgi:hypothetical protein